MIRILALLAPLFLFISCINGEEELTVNFDASGTFTARYEFPTAAAASLGPPARYRRELERIDQEEDSIEITHLEFGFVRGKLLIHIKAKFDNVTKLLEISERQKGKFAKGVGMDAGELDLLADGISVDLNNLKVDYSRAMDLRPILPSMAINNPRLLRDSKFRFKINLPVAIESSNAHAISPDRKSISWEFMLRDYVDKPINMTFKTETITPWWLWVLFVALVLIGFFTIRKLTRRFR